jgi:hypothetical protein
VRHVLLVLATVALAACSFANQQLGISSTNACIRQQCRDPDARDYTRCEAACRAQYQR